MIRLTIPTVVERVVEDVRRPLYEVRPLFFSGFEKRAEREDRAVERCTHGLRSAAIDLAKDSDHRGLATWSFYPALSRHHLRLPLRLRKRTCDLRFFLVAFKEFDRRIVFCPKHPDIFFDVMRGETLEGRALDVLTDYFRRAEKDDGITPEAVATSGSARLSEISIDVNARQKLPEEDPYRHFAGIGSGETMDGAAELERTGRCLDRLYPNRLAHAILREEEIARLLALFRRPKTERRPIVLVGGSQVGKTAIVHEFVRRRIEKPDTKRKQENGNVWLLGPQRLLSGMSYVGQWEGRLLAIIEESRRRGHLLYFDDLPGLFQAGKSRDSDLTMGHLLKAQLEEKAPLVLAEATQEQWRRLKEIDRGFTDHFQVVPVREPDTSDTVRILIRVIQEIERERGCEFEPGVLPMVMQLQRRFARTRLFPGKAAEQLHQLAASRTGQESISADDTLAHFQAKSGIANLFLDRSRTIARRDILSFFKKRIAGQEAAVDAMVDAVSMAKAGLNDADRPLASLLFLGPTGVGKTECAKALAEFVFGTPERLLRLDMNEFTDFDAVARLIGSESRQRGQLTNAIIRQPYGVLLLDEVEKAHPDVFDLLLQVLGDGRLTDASGRTADFCNAIIILTSNLGARAARQQMGYGAATHEDTRVYVSAAETFFRPEFFNRLDRVVPFHELTRDHIAGMVERMAKKALGRYGFRQRRMMLEVDPPVFERIVARGFDPESGARALRRAVEEELVQPLASQIAASRTGDMAALRIELDETEKPILRTSTFEEAPRHPFRIRPLSPRRAAAVVEAGNEFLLRIESRLADIEDQCDDDDFSARASYYALREDVNAIRILRDRLMSTIERALDTRRKATKPALEGRHSTRMRIPVKWSGTLLSTFNTAPSAAKFMRDLFNEAEIADWVPFAIENFVNRVNHLDFALAGDPDESVALPVPDPLMMPITNTFDGAEWRRETNDVRFTGARMGGLLEYVKGNHLVFGFNGEMHFHSFGEHANLPVIRIQDVEGNVLDLRTGIIHRDADRPLWDFINPILPVAPEFAEFMIREEEL